MKRRLIAGVINYYEAEDGWENIHLDVSDRDLYHSGIGTFVRPDVIADLGAELPMFEERIFDEARLHHVLEHMSAEDAWRAVRALYRVLKPGGVLDVEVPDMDRIALAWVERRFDPMELQQWLFGEDLGSPSDWHRFAYNEEMMRKLLTEAGFEVGEREETDLALRFVARKPPGREAEG